MELMEDEDVLEAGIRIIAQPPGKKLQNMMQLSGGEKALTAISLLFAIQNLKPSPFCLLDEIEAGLPTCRSLEAPFYKMVLKSGSFGSEAFIEKSIEKLLLVKEQEDGCLGTPGEAD